MNTLKIRFAGLAAICFVMLFARVGNAQQPSWHVYDDSLSQGALSEQPVVVDLQGNVWVIFLSGVVGRFDGQNWTNYNSANGLPGGAAHAIIYDHAGNIWMSSDSGIAEFKDGSWHSYTIQDKLTAIRTYGALAADSNGNIWVATFSEIFIEQLPGATYDSTWNEFYRFDGNAWTSFTPGYVYNWPGFNSIAIGLDGMLWGAGQDATDTARKVSTAGLWRFDGTSWQSFNIGQGTGFIAQPVGNTGAMTIVEGNALHPDGNGGVWVTLGMSSPTSAIAIYYFNGSAWDTTGLSGRRFSDIWIAPNGDKYFRSNTRNKYGYTTDTGSLVIVGSNGNLDSIPMAEIPFFPFASIQFSQDGTPWLSSPWGTGNGNLGVGLETMAPASQVIHNDNSDAGVQYSAYPNPFKTSTNISYSLAEDGYVTISLFNSDGVRVASLVSENETSGEHTLAVSDLGLPSGNYRAEINATNGYGQLTRSCVNLSLIK